MIAQADYMLAGQGLIPGGKDSHSPLHHIQTALESTQPPIQW